MPSSGVVLAHLVYPLFSLPSAAEMEFLGTSFVAAPGILVTCWHCVESAVKAGSRICVMSVARTEPAFVVLRDIAQDANGADLATASVNVIPVGPMPRLSSPIVTPTDVCTWGYPLTRFERKTPDDPGTYRLEPRYLQGYVTRYFVHDAGRFGRARSYEMDMPAPAGLSGAPLVRVGSDEVVGVIYGTLDVARSEEAATVDPETGVRTPEVQRIVSFALAYHTLALAAVRGAATGGRSLSELMPA